MPSFLFPKLGAKRVVSKLAWEPDHQSGPKTGKFPCLSSTSKDASGCAAPSI